MSFSPFVFIFIHFHHTTPGFIHDPLLLLPFIFHFTVRKMYNRCKLESNIWKKLSARQVDKWYGYVCCYARLASILFAQCVFYQFLLAADDMHM